MRILIMTDLEGVAGVVDSATQCQGEGKYVEQAKELLTEEVNASCRGALEGGAAEILVVDGHGPGAILPGKIHPEATLLHGRPVPVLWEMDKKWDAVFLLGHHAMNSVYDGNLNHTYSSATIVRMLLNGKPVGEIGMNVYLAGWYGIPCVLVTGDEAAAREAEAYVPGIEKCVVKRGINRTCAVTLSPVKARSLIEESSARAVARIKDIPPVKAEGECELITEWINSANVFLYEKKPHAEVLDGARTRVHGKDFMDMWIKWRA